MRIVLDAMGTDRHPAVEVQGAMDAVRELPGDFRIVLVGDGARIEAELSRAGASSLSGIEVVDAPERIAPGEAPATAVRRKAHSSIVVGLALQREGKAQAFVSAGSTGAVMAASLFVLRPVAGVDRPAIATMLPTAGEPVILVDAGANVDSKPYHLLQFAHLGVVYAQDVLGRLQPRVGLLNIGEEPEKGNELAVEAHRLLRDSGLYFMGNVEGRDVIEGACDVLVADGFVGNVLLKFYESVAGFVYGLLTRELAQAHADLHLEKVFQVLDYTEYGGAPLLGVNGISIICHGGSPPRAIRNAIRVAVQAVETDMVGDIRTAMAGVSGRGGDAPRARGATGQRFLEGA
ncbi:MAG: phosphate acyltransferase PlsX [Gemmatimonadetes bacterium]|nr:phosphate acyltransferase PlsX [Gemmatimonadota bacterium]